MRLVQILIPTGKRDAVLGVLAEEGIDYVLTDETSGREFTAVVTFPVPTNALEPVLEELRNVGINDDGYTVVVDANTVISSQFDELEEKYAEEEDEDRIAREELTSKANDLAPSMSNYALMTIISAIIATAGLLLDSPAVVVGSMVIAPLIGPAMTANVGTVVDDHEMFIQASNSRPSARTRRGKRDCLCPAGPVRQRHPAARRCDHSRPDTRAGRPRLPLADRRARRWRGRRRQPHQRRLDGTGRRHDRRRAHPAGGHGRHRYRVGPTARQPRVRRVAACERPLDQPRSARRALVSGYRPEHWFQESNARSATVKRIGVLVLSILVLSAFLGGVTFDSYQQATTESDIRDAIQAASTRRLAC